MARRFSSMRREPTGCAIPLAITLSRDGRLFDRAWVLRGAADLQPLRFEGLYKRPGYHYPKSVIWKDHLYVGYATNKEDVELTRVPLSELGTLPISKQKGPHLSAP